MTQEGHVQGALSQVLGKRVGVDKRASGAPYIKGDDHYLSLSHKDGKMVVAISDRPVGVDIERLVEKEAYYRIADAYFGETIAEGDVEGFFRGWTRRESFGKMLGKGLDGEIMRMNMNEEVTHEGRRVCFVEKRVEEYMITVAGYYPDGEMVFVGGKSDEE